MKDVFRIFSAFTAATLLLAGSSQAAYIHLSSTPDLSGSPTLFASEPVGPNFLYVVASDTSEIRVGIDAVEFSIPALNDPTILILDFRLAPGGINVGTNTNVLAGFPAPLVGESVVLATYEFLFLTPPNADDLWSIEAYVPSSVGGAGPAFVSNRGRSTMAFDFASSLLVNQVASPTPDLVPEPSVLSLLAGFSLLALRRRR
jgi:hypothetical protein